MYGKNRPTNIENMEENNLIFTKLLFEETEQTHQKRFVCSKAWIKVCIKNVSKCSFLDAGNALNDRLQKRLENLLEMKVVAANEIAFWVTRKVTECFRELL